jgi:hypothetical protein
VRKVAGRFVHSPRMTGYLFQCTAFAGFSRSASCAGVCAAATLAYPLRPAVIDRIISRSHT